MSIKTTFACIKCRADHPTLRGSAFHSVVTEETSGKIDDLFILVRQKLYLLFRDTFIACFGSIYFIGWFL